MATEEKLPAYLRKRLEERFGPEERERILNGYGCGRSSAFRLNLLRGEPEETLKELADIAMKKDPDDPRVRAVEEAAARERAGN